jgi:hypothetical protein
MKESGFAQRKLGDDVEKRRRGRWPLFVQLDKGRFDLDRIERGSCFFSYPTITATHRAQHHADLAQRLVWRRLID